VFSKGVSLLPEQGCQSLVPRVCTATIPDRQFR
jgi:hypothetical protein